LLQLSSYVLFVKGGNELVAILVDQVLGNREVVAKPLGPQLDTLVGVVGATVLGNGEIALIINPLLLARRTGIRRLASRPAEIAPRVEQKMVMVVDDSLTVRKVMQRLLAREGYAVATATDGYDAIRQLHDLTPDIFLVDIEMPRMDGYTLVRHLRDNESTRSKPIIMITSRTGAKHRERAMEVGVNHYMGKPYQDEQLLELIRHFTSDASGRAEDDFSDVLY
jgi:CheY-like chemotaxis protein